jgi:CubicO group peptidase (beta-lactamase class C family)
MSEQQQEIRSMSGFVKPGFEPVREAFLENFKRRNEIGAACCIYYHGEKVVDLWGGIRNRTTSEPWEQNTMVLVFSATKGMSGLAIALANSSGLLEYDERVSKYWPEFAQQGKETITIRQLLGHQAGLFGLDVRLDKDLVLDFDRLASVLAKEKPAWEPGMYQAYHAITLGFYEGELIRRVDPKHRSLGQFFQDEIATPLALDFYIRLPEEIPNSRLAILKMDNPAAGIFSYPIALTLSVMNPHSVFRRAFKMEVRDLLQDPEHIYQRNLEIPSGTGVGSAPAIAKAYSVFATGGRELNLKQETLNALMAPPIPPAHGFHDECLKVDSALSLGFLRPVKQNPFGHPSSFGAPGSGGSFGFADPHNGIGYAYVLNRMGSHLIDPRDLALRAAMYKSIGKPNPYFAAD